MNHRRIGQLLSSVVPITDHDIEEILQEQNLTRRPFGQIAVSWGLCTPAHVWQAWAHQPDHPTPRVDLSQIGIDAQAAALIPRSLAIQNNAISIRSYENLIIIAISDPSNRPALEQHLGAAGRELAFVLADPKQISDAIVRYFPSVAA